MKNKGITLISLVVTVVVMLILAGVSVAMVTGGEDSTIKQAQKAKNDTEIGEEKEIILICASKAAGKDKAGELTEENLRTELEKSMKQAERTFKLEIVENEKFKITINNDRIYILNQNGQIEE